MNRILLIAGLLIALVFTASADRRRALLANRTQAAETVVLPLELVSTPAAGAYDIGRLATNGWTSALGLVARSSDGATNYVTGTSTGSNKAALESWSGGGNVYLTNFYEQAGTGRHLVQGDTNLCFVIITNGVAVTDANGNLAMMRLGANAHMVALSVALNEPVSGIVSVYNASKTAGDVIVGGGGTSRHNLEQATGSTYRLDNTSSVDAGTLTQDQWDIITYKFLVTASDPDAVAVDGGTFSTGEAGSNAGTSLNVGNATVGADIIIGSSTLR